MRCALILLVLLVVGTPAQAQFWPPPGLHISAAEIEVFRQKAVAGNIVEQIVKESDGVTLALIRYVEPEGGGSSLWGVTEIYQVISGTGTLRTGGILNFPIYERFAAGEGERGFQNGGEESVVGPGDVIILPPRTVHGFTEVEGEIIYLAYRFAERP